MSIALAICGLVLLALGLHPFVTYPLSLRLLARWRSRPVMAGPVPHRVAFCVCAYNEERVIRAKVENMLAVGAAIGGIEALVYVDGASDRTADIVRAFGDRVRLVASPARLGKTHGMNTLVAMTDAEIVVFSDANVTFAADALPALLAPFGDPSVGCVCGHLVYTKAAGSVTAVTGSLYWRLEEAIKQAESLTGSVMGADGSIFALRRAVHEPPPPDLIDDMYISLAALCRGHRIVRAPGAFAYEEAVSRPGEEFRRKVRIACQAFNVHRALWPRLRRLPALDLYKYVSHKLLRWLTIALLASGGLCLLAALAVAGLWMALSVMLALGLAGAGAMLAVPRGPVATLRDVLGAFVATGLGVWRSWRGDRFQTWTPPASARAMPGPPASSRT